MSIALLQFLTVPMFRNVTLKCLTEISGISTAQYPQYEKAFKDLFAQTMDQLKQVRKNVLKFGGENNYDG